MSKVSVCSGSVRNVYDFCFIVCWSSSIVLFPMLKVTALTIIYLTVRALRMLQCMYNVYSNYVHTVPRVNYYQLQLDKSLKVT